MESKSFIQTLRNKDWRFKSASSLDDVLCLSSMISHCVLDELSDVETAIAVWVEAYEGDCLNCPCYSDCLACLINE